MKLWHTTLKCRTPSIALHGLLTSKSQGRLKAVWLHTEDRVTWAFLHCVRRHGGRVEDVVSIEVEVDPSVVKASSAEGLFYTLEDVSPEAFGRITGFRKVSESPVKGALRHGR